MATIREKFDASTNITVTLASLANNSARESNVVDNTSNLYVDVLLMLQVKLPAGSPSGSINIYAFGSEDGTNYGDNAAGTGDAALTMRSPTNLVLVGIINTPTSGALTYKSQPFSLARAFGGMLPRKWGIVVENKTGLAFDATEGNHAKRYTGTWMESV